ncbi:MAG: hypothetical protein AB1757_07320 [Acidobacteriota bacterium]
MKQQIETTESREQFEGEDHSKAETLVDLTVDGETPAQVKGGVLIGQLLPAVQKIR